MKFINLLMKKTCIIIITLALILTGIYIPSLEAEAENAGNITFSSVVISNKNGELSDTNKIGLTEAVTYRAGYSVNDVLKSIEDVTAAITEGKNGAYYPIMTGDAALSWINAADFVDTDLNLTYETDLEGSIASHTEKVGQLCYLDFSEGETAGLPAGFYIRLISTGKIDSDVEPASGLCKVYKDTGENIFAGSLEFSAKAALTADDYGKSKDIELIGGESFTLHVEDNPNKPQAPEFSKAGTYEDNCIIWTIKVKRNNTYDHTKFVLTDDFKAGDADAQYVDISKEPVVTVTGVDLGANPVPGTVDVIDSGAPDENVQALYADGKFTYPITFEADDVTEKTITIKTEVDPDKVFIDSDGNILTGELSVPNTAKLEDQADTGRINPPDATATAKIPRDRKVSKNCVLQTDGSFDCTIIVEDVNTSYIADLIIYDEISSEWKVDGVPVVKGKNAGEAEETLVLDGSAYVAINDTSTTVAGVSPEKAFTDGFVLKLMKYNSNDGIKTGEPQYAPITKYSQYIITYKAIPKIGLDAYYDANTGKDQTMTNNAYLYCTFKFPGGTEPGLAPVIKPPAISQNVGSQIATKAATATPYDAASQTIEWQVDINKYKVKNVTEVTVDDKMGANQQLYLGAALEQPTGAIGAAGSYSWESADSVDLAVLKQIFYSLNETDITTYITRVEYGLSAEAGQKYDLKITISDAIKGNESAGNALSLRYRTQIIEAAVIAGNVEGKDNKTYQNEVTGHYKKSGIEQTVTESKAGKKIISEMLSKESNGYDYSNGQLSWTVTANTNKMILSRQEGVATAVTLPTEVTLSENINIDQSLYIDNGNHVDIKIYRDNEASPIAEITSLTQTGHGNKNEYYVTYSGDIAYSTEQIAGYDTGSYIAAHPDAQKLIIHFPTYDSDGNKILNSIDGHQMKVVYATVLKNPDAIFGQNAVSGQYNTSYIAQNKVTLNSAYPTLSEEAQTPVGLNMLTKTAAFSSGIVELKYSVGINPLKAKLIADFTIVDTLPNKVMLDTSSIEIYPATLNKVGTTFTRASGSADCYKADNLSITTLADGRMQFRYNMNLNDSSNYTAIADRYLQTYILSYTCYYTGTASAELENKVELDGTNLSGGTAVKNVSMNYSSGSINASIGSSLGKLTIEKVIKGTTTGLPGAEFRCEGPVSNAGLATALTQTTHATTDSSGTAVFRFLTLNSYYKITEVTPPNGYINKNYSTIVYVGSGSAKNVELTVENEPNPWTVTLIKKDQYDRAVIGAKFAIYTVADQTTPLTTVVSDNSGLLTFDMNAYKAAPYKFAIKEIEAPAGISFDPLTAQTYYFSFNQYGVCSGICTEESANGVAAGTVITSVVNTSQIPPITSAVQPQIPTQNENTVSAYEPSEQEAPTTARVKPTPSFTPAAILEANAATDGSKNGLLGKRLPKTGGLTGSIMIFSAGFAIMTAGICIGRAGQKGKRKKRKHE